MQVYSISNRMTDWDIETYSTRKASLENIAVIPGRKTLQVILGGGRGDLFYMGQATSYQQNCDSLQFQVLARVFDGEPVKIGLVFTTRSERPWLELEGKELKPGVWQEIEFDLSDLDEDKLARTNHLNLLIQTNGDEGFILFDQIEFRGKT